MMMPFGPASNFSTWALRQSALIATSFINCSTSRGSGPKRSIISAAKALDLGIVLQRREPAIEPEPQIEIGDIIFRDRHRRAERDRRRPGLFRRLFYARLQGNDRLVQHLLIELIADLLDMAGLFFAKQIAGAANVEIMARELEAGAERVERLQHLQPPLRLRRQRAVLPAR